MNKFRWVIVFFAFLGIIISYMDRVSISYAIQPIEQLFILNDKQFGVIAAIFGVGYLFMMIIGGILIDRFGARKIWFIFEILMSLSCIGIGLAGRFAHLVIFRFLLGIAQAPVLPCLARVTSEWLPVSERGRSLAIGLAAVPCASLIGAPIFSYLITVFNWRIMFFLLASLGIIWSLIWYFIFRDTPKQSQFVSTSELNYIESGLIAPSYHDHHRLAEHKTTWKFMLLDRSMLTNNFASFTFGYMVFFAINWLPAYLEKTFLIPIKSAGWYLTMPWLLAVILVLAGGMLCDSLWKKTKSIRISRSYPIWICQFLSALCFIPALMTHSEVVAIISISLGVGLGSMPNAAFYALNGDLAHDRVATSLSIMNSAFALAGIISPYITGLISSRTGKFSEAILIIIILKLMSAVLVLLFQHPDKSLEMKNIRSH